MLVSLFNEARPKTALISTGAGEFSLDAVTVESHISKLRITENPIESGSKVVDHCVLDPKEITINGVLVNYKPRVSITTNALGNGNVNINQYPLPIEVKVITAEAEAYVKKYLSHYANVMEEKRRIENDWLGGADNSEATNRVSTMYEMLLKLQKAGRTVTVNTKTKQYKNMLINSISLVQNREHSATVSIVLREIFIVATKKGSGLSVKRDFGRTVPQEVSKSVLKSTIGGK